MLENIKITSKFLLVIIMLALVSALATGFIAYSIASSNIKLTAENSLYSLLESRKASLENYFCNIQKDLEFHAQSRLIVEAIEEYTKAWSLLPGNKMKYLQSLYIYRNPYLIKQKDALLKANDGSLYSELHNLYHPTFRNLVTARNFYDLFLFDREGNLIYSVKKEQDFASNMVTGLWKSSHLAQVFNIINENPIPGKQIFADFEPYAPSNHVPASFIGLPVYDDQANYIGVLAFQMNIDTLNQVMQVTAGMGVSGETYLVGADFLMRSDSRFLKGRSTLKTKVDTPSVRRALDGESGIDVIRDYRDTLVFSAFTPINFFNTHWAIIAEMDKSEILQPVYDLNKYLIMSSFIIAIVICLIGYWLATNISRPIVTMTNAMKRLAENDLGVNISVSERQDEVGGMANAMVEFKRNAIERDELQKKLSYMANHDILTGLPSRKYAMERLEILLEKPRTEEGSLVVMFADLDNFKTVNDTLGHQVGDQLLKEVAALFSRCVRKEDMVARMGGDEFIIILPNVNSEDDFCRVADKILQSMSTDFAILNGRCKVTVSIGIVFYPQHGDDSFSLIKQADRAMYAAKESGKNKYYFQKC